MSDALPQIGPAAASRDFDQLSQAKRLAARGDVDQAAKKFESLLASQLVKEMRKGITDGFFGEGAGSDVYEGWLDEHLGQAIAASGALDLGGAIRVSLGQKQGAQADAQSTSTPRKERP